MSREFILFIFKPAFTISLIFFFSLFPFLFLPLSSSPLLQLLDRCHVHYFSFRFIVTGFFTCHISLKIIPTLIKLPKNRSMTLTEFHSSELMLTRESTLGKHVSSVEKRFLPFIFQFHMRWRVFKSIEPTQKHDESPMTLRRFSDCSAHFRKHAFTVLLGKVFIQQFWKQELLRKDCIHNEFTKPTHLVDQMVNTLSWRHVRERSIVKTITQLD
mmetsp:Transcript_6846/g.12252  ORF Transcript_6846/g.12252 Transcript_6846/m.12252 type:complete len:214 (-) Transcript_6846:1034-1675(-)